MITLQELHERDQRPPSVTVYMICYNHEKYLDEAIQSVLMQKTNFPVNIVIHDDASTDRSAENIRRYADENPNITAILEETNFYQNGKSFFPIVLPYLTGKYIAYCECDDFWIDENKLQIQVDYLENNPDCSAVYSNTLPVNKYGVYDEASRSYINPKTGEGDYERWQIVNGVKHQLASCVMRNLMQFFTQEDMYNYIKNRTNGDNKILALCLSIGRVHYFAQEFAAYRYVISEGNSYSARFSRLKGFDIIKHVALICSELYLFIEHCFGEQYYRKYIKVLWWELESRIKFHKSVIDEANLDPSYHLKNIPLYAYVVFSFYVAYRLMRKIGRMIFCRKQSKN